MTGSGTLKITSRGQATFRQEVLRHLGIGPGDRVEMELLPDGVVRLRAARPSAPVTELVGLLRGRGGVTVRTIEQIRAANAEVGRVRETR